MNHPEIFVEDLKNIVCLPKAFFKALTGKTILITGATGLIGFSLVNALLAANQKYKLNIHILAQIRNPEKAKQLFGAVNSAIQYIVSDIAQKFSINGPVDYIIHTANQTSSKAFVNEPIETIRTAIDGTLNMLELAREKKSESFVFLSSMEVYGSPTTDEKINEDYPTNLNTMVVRTSYPESKRMCESLCASFATEYGVSAKVIRLTQTFGPGVSYNDGRVFADFVRCALKGRDIILHTKGETKRNYLYTADAVTAILTVLLKGKIGEAYNAANEDTYCSIFEMANLVAKHCGTKKSSVVIQEDDIFKFGYAPVLKMNLDTSKLRALGWKPTKNLVEMFIRLSQTMQA